jgi:predicted porin
MKKSLIALAVLAASGAVMAQSSVTVYGKLETSYQKLSSAGATLGGIHGSRVGFRGTEDLGGGLKANFQMEHRFTPDDGAQGGGVMWNGLSTVGVSGGFGSVNFGRQYTASFLGANNMADPFGGDGAGALRSIGMRTTNVDGTLRVGNSIKYNGSFGPVNVAVSTGLKEAAAGSNHLGMAIGYAAGPVGVGFGFDKGTTVAAGAQPKVTNFYASYNLGFAKVTLGTGKSQNTAADGKGMLLGVTAPVGTGTLMAGYASAKTLAGVSTNSKFGLGYAYPLSKRTSLEVTYGNDSKVAAGIVGKSGYDFTLHHNF